MSVTIADPSALSDEMLAARLKNWAHSVGKGDRIGSTERRIIAVLLSESARRVTERGNASHG